MIEILMIKGFFEYVQIKKADDLDMAIKKEILAFPKNAGKSLQGSRMIEIFIMCENLGKKPTKLISVLNLLIPGHLSY